ncbi:hypothetical protein IE3_01981 [Bacillus cereus BAG3X2-1]|nr:hypothetical protein IE3_01981 [Bacillus cereus BAG3X2-1]
MLWYKKLRVQNIVHGVFLGVLKHKIFLQI